MNDGPAILRAILEDPYDDLPRLAYADWLEETGRNANRMESSSFIRGGLNNPEFETLCEQHRDGKREMILVFRRGFICRVELQLDVFIKHAESLFLTHPITEVKLTDREPYVSHVASWYDASGQMGGVNPFSSDLPTELFLALKDDDRFTITEGVKYYSSLDIAFAALSSACVTYGRQLAKLPALPNLNAISTARL